MRSEIKVLAAVSALLLGAVSARADSVIVPYAGAFNENTVAGPVDGLPAGDFDTIGGLNDVGLFNLVAGVNTFTGSAKTPNDSSDAFLIGIGPNQTLISASIVFGTNLNDFNPLFAAPGPHLVLEESDPTPTIFDIAVGSNGQSGPVTFNAPSFTRGTGIYSVLFGNGTFASNNNDPVGYVITFNVTETTPPVETPLPAALPLFATGLGAMGFLGWRRKKKAQAA